MGSLAHRGFCRFLVPRYDEVVLFAASLTCVLLLLAGLPSFRGEVKIAAPRVSDIRFFAAGCVFIAGLLLSLSRVFVPRPPSDIEKSFMLFFIVLLNAFSGFMAGGYELTHTIGWRFLFPLVNMANSVVLLFLWRGGVVDESCIDGRRAPKGEVLLAAAAVLLLFLLCRVVFRLIWIETLSICLVFSANLIGLLELIVFRRRAGGADRRYAEEVP